MVTWRNRSIDTLSPPELRRALDDAINEIAWSRAAPSTGPFFSALLVGFAAGSLVSALAVVTFSILT